MISFVSTFKRQTNSQLEVNCGSFKLTLVSIIHILELLCPEN